MAKKAAKKKTAKKKRATKRTASAASKGSRPRMTDNEKKKVVSAYRAGKKPQQIADEIGRSYRTVLNSLKKQGVYKGRSARTSSTRSTSSSRARSKSAGSVREIVVNALLDAHQQGKLTTNVLIKAIGKAEAF